MSPKILKRFAKIEMDPPLDSSMSFVQPVRPVRPAKSKQALVQSKPIQTKGTEVKASDLGMEELIPQKSKPDIFPILYQTVTPYGDDPVVIYSDGRCYSGRDQTPIRAGGTSLESINKSTFKAGELVSLRKIAGGGFQWIPSKDGVFTAIVSIKNGIVE